MRSTLRSRFCASSITTKLSVRLRPRMWVRGSTSSSPRSRTSSITSWLIDRFEGVDDRGRPRAHLLGLGARAGTRGPGRRPSRGAGTRRPACACAASSTASSPAASASTLLPVPALPPRLTMPISGSASRSMATRCSAERPRTSNTAASVRTRCSRLSAWTRARADCEPACSARPVWQGRSRAAARSATRSSYSSSISPGSTSSSVKPVQLVSAASSLRYSSAASPTMLAFRRSGRSLVTTATSAPSLARLRATARMRWSLASEPAGRRAGRPGPGG